MGEEPGPSVLCNLPSAVYRLQFSTVCRLCFSDQCVPENCGSTRAENNSILRMT